MTNAVIVEDDPLACMTLGHLLESEGFTVRCFHNTDEARQSCLQLPPDILITDWCVPGSVSPRELVRDVQHLSGHTRVVFMSGYAPEDLDVDFAQLPGVEYFSKPLNFDRFVIDLKSEPRSLENHAQ